MTYQTGSPFETYQPPAYEESDSFPPAENRGKPLIVKVLEHKHIPTTKFKPEGGPGVICDVVDLSTGTKYRRVLWMSGAIVDGLSQYAGRGMLVVFFGEGVAKSGNRYTTVQPATPDMLAYAQQWVTQHGDPFPPELSVPAPAAAPAWQAPAGAQPWTAQAPAPQVATAPAAPAQQAQAAPAPWRQPAAQAPVAPVAPAAPAAQPAWTAQQPPMQAPGGDGPAPWEQPAAPAAPAAPAQAAPAAQAQGAVPPWERQS